MMFILTWCFSVIWGLISDEATEAAGQQLDAAFNGIRHDFSRRWQALDMLKSILSSIHYPCEIKSHSIELILHIMDGSDAKESNNQSVDFSTFTPSIFAVLKVQSPFLSWKGIFLKSTAHIVEWIFQGIEKIMIYAPEASSRKKAFAALKKVTILLAFESFYCHVCLDLTYLVFSMMFLSSIILFFKFKLYWENEVTFLLGDASELIMLCSLSFWNQAAHWHLGKHYYSDDNNKASSCFFDSVQLLHESFAFNSVVHLFYPPA